MQPRVGRTIGGFGAAPRELPQLRCNPTLSCCCSVANAPSTLRQPPSSLSLASPLPLFFQHELRTTTQQLLASRAQQHTQNTDDNLGPRIEASPLPHAVSPPSHPHRPSFVRSSPSRETHLNQRDRALPTLRLSSFHPKENVNKQACLPIRNTGVQGSRRRRLTRTGPLCRPCQTHASRASMRSMVRRRTFSRLR